jgi:hypothetical protein
MPILNLNIKIFRLVPAAGKWRKRTENAEASERERDTQARNGKPFVINEIHSSIHVHHGVEESE